MPSRFLVIVYLAKALSNLYELRSSSLLSLSLSHLLPASRKREEYRKVFEETSDPASYEIDFKASENPASILPSIVKLSFCTFSFTPLPNSTNNVQEIDFTTIYGPSLSLHIFRLYNLWDFFYLFERKGMQIKFSHGLLTFPQVCKFDFPYFLKQAIWILYLSQSFVYIWGDNLMKFSPNKKGWPSCVPNFVTYFRFIIYEVLHVSSREFVQLLLR